MDANIFMTAWYITYPKDVFSEVWNDLAKVRDQLIIISPIFDEIEPYASTDKIKPRNELEDKYPLRLWLERNNFNSVDIETSIKDEAIDLERKYEIEDRGKGVNKNDILLITYARKNKYCVVTFESKQLQPPTEKKNYKIPLVCEIEKVDCMSFVEMLRELKK